MKKKLLLLYSFIHQLPFRMTLLTCRDTVSVPCRLTVVKGDAFMLKALIKFTETFEILLHLKLADSS